jgi:hypothetical protein
VVRILSAVILLKLGPEDVPYSLRLLQRGLVLYLISGLMLLIGRVDNTTALLQVLVDVSIMLGFSYSVLASLHKRARYIQTATTLAGVGVMYNLVNLPLLIVLEAQPGEGVAPLVVLLMWALISWQVLVVAHIFRRALNSTMINAIALSFALLVISVTVSQLLFSEAT